MLHTGLQRSHHPCPSLVQGTGYLPKQVGVNRLNRFNEQLKKGEIALVVANDPTKVAWKGIAKRVKEGRTPLGSLANQINAVVGDDEEPVLSQPREESLSDSDSDADGGA